MGWFLTVCPVLGIIAMAMSLSHLLPVATSLILEDGTTGVFLSSMGLNFAVGALLWAKLAVARLPPWLGLRVADLYCRLSGQPPRGDAW